MKSRVPSLACILLLSFQSLWQGGPIPAEPTRLSPAPQSAIVSDELTPVSTATLPTSPAVEESWVVTPWTIPDQTGVDDERPLTSPPSKALLLPGRILTTLATTSDL